MRVVYLASGMPRKFCTADAPMNMEDKDSFQWGHPDAVEVESFFNLMVYNCPHCKLNFLAVAREGKTNEPE